MAANNSRCQAASDRSCRCHRIGSRQQCSVELLLRPKGTSARINHKVGLLRLRLAPGTRQRLAGLPVPRTTCGPGARPRGVVGMSLTSYLTAAVLVFLAGLVVGSVVVFVTHSLSVLNERRGYRQLMRKREK